MMGDWKKYNLNQLAIGIFDCPHSTPRWTEKGILVVRNFNIKNGKLLFDRPSYTDEKNYRERIKRATPCAGDLILTREAPMGDICMIPENLKCCLGQRVVLIKPDRKKVYPKYLLYKLQSSEVQNQIKMSEGTGSVVSNLRIPYIENLELSLPSYNSQSRIASILSSLDDKIELNRRMNQTLEQMAQALFNHYFVDNIDPDNLPKGWKNVGLSEIVEITSSKRIFLNEYVSVGVPFYRGKEIIQLNKSGLINTELFIDENKFQEIKEKFGAPKSGDILITSVGTIGIPYLVDKSDEFYFKDGNLTWIKNYLDFIGPYYLYQWLISDSGQQQIKDITIGSTQKAITIVSLKGIRLLIPPKELHDQVSIQLQNIRKKIVNNVTQIKLLSKIRDTLLPKLMSGEIDVDKIMREEQLIENELADCKIA